MKPEKKPIGIGWMAGLAGLCLLLVSGCSGTNDLVQAEEEQAIPVQVAYATRGSLSVEEHLYGTVAPAREALVVPKLNGTLQVLAVERNDRVEKGQRLAVIEHEQLEIQKRMQELAVEQALDQYRSLQNSGASQQQLDQAMRSIEQARLNLRLAELNLENAVVTAPISGRLTEVNAEEGDLVSSASPLFRITADERMTVSVNVSAKQRMLFLDMKEVDVTFPDLGITMPADIRHVSSLPSGGFYAVEAELDNADGAIVAGMTARFVLTNVLVEDAVLVPTAALVEKGGETRVFAALDGRAKEIIVDVLETQSDWSAVSGDLIEGTPVVTKGQLLLQDGAPVEIVGEGQ